MLTFDKMFAAKACILRWLAFFAFLRDVGTSNSTNPQSPLFWIFSLGRVPVKAQTLLVSSSVVASDCTTVGHYKDRQTKQQTAQSWPDGQQKTVVFCSLGSRSHTEVMRRGNYECWSLTFAYCCLRTALLLSFCCSLSFDKLHCEMPSSA